MSLGADDLQEMDRILSAPESSEAAVADLLRQTFPKLSLTRCAASDVTEEPFRVYSKFEVHLLDRSEHCVQITADPERATGIVLASRT